jgi:hypothetical protein
LHAELLGEVAQEQRELEVGAAGDGVGLLADECVQVGQRVADVLLTEDVALRQHRRDERNQLPPYTAKTCTLIIK